MAQYVDLKSQCEDQGWTCHVYLVEVGHCGFAGRPTFQFLTDIGVAPNARGSVIVQLHFRQLVG